MAQAVMKREKKPLSILSLRFRELFGRQVHREQIVFQFYRLDSMNGTVSTEISADYFQFYRLDSAQSVGAISVNATIVFQFYRLDSTRSWRVVMAM